MVRSRMCIVADSSGSDASEINLGPSSRREIQLYHRVVPLTIPPSLGSRLSSAACQRWSLWRVPPQRGRSRPRDRSRCVLARHRTIGRNTPRCPDFPPLPPHVQLIPLCPFRSLSTSRSASPTIHSRSTDSSPTSSRPPTSRCSPCTVARSAHPNAAGDSEDFALREWQSAERWSMLRSCGLGGSRAR